MVCDRPTQSLEYFWVQTTPSQVKDTVIPPSSKDLTTVTSFSPDLVAFWLVVILFPARLTVVLHFRPSVVVSSNSSPSLNLSSMLLTVVFVIIVQLPPSSAMVMTGVEAMAAFLKMNPTFSFFKKSSYPSFEV